MVTFYFIDTNLILGYCNFLDRIHLISKDLLDTLNYGRSKYIILLFSIEKEFNLKIQKEMDRFQQKLTTFLDKNIDGLTEIIKGWGKLNNFETYIFDLFKKRKINKVTRANSIQISLDYYKELSHTFDILTKNWIKRPHGNEYQYVKTTRNYNQVKRKASPLFHPPDDEHITLAGYEALNNQTHDYKFYTSDGGWIGKDQLLGIRNLQIILKLQKQFKIGGKSIAEYSAAIFLQLKEGYTCVIMGMGYMISKVVSIVLFLGDNFFDTLRIIRILPNSLIKENNRRISTIEIYINID